MTAPTPEEVAEMVAAKLEFAVTLRQRGRNHDAEVEVQEAEFIRAVQAARKAAERVCEALAHYDAAETANVAVFRWPAVIEALDAWRAARAQGGEG